MSEVKVNKISPRTNCGTVTVGDSGDSVSVTAGVPVTVNGDLKSNALKAVDGGSIISQCGTNITLGASGDTINLAAGASQTGFGRTGTVDWDTTAKTASFTAVSGTGYFVNTTSGAITVTLPASPSAGDIVSVADYAGTVTTNSITIARNGSNINGSAEDLTINRNNSGIFLVYVDATQGWKNTETSNLNDIELQPEYITATGGTITESGDYKIHTFTGPGTFTVCSVGNCTGSDSVDYLVIAGGGGGGSDQGGGGGAGGYRESSGAASGCYSRSPLGACVSALPVAVQGYPIAIGGGGQGAIIGCRAGANGNNSSFSTIISTGGGKGGTLISPGQGSPGGSGGGGGAGGESGGCGGSGNSPPVSPPQGTPGGDAPAPSDYGAGGGGATSAGVNGNPGGAGATSSITGSAVGRAGGGGGRSSSGPAGVPFGAGTYTPNPGPGAQNGTANTGSGAGGSGVGGPAPSNIGGTGGSGIVVIRYKFQ